MKRLDEMEFLEISEIYKDLSKDIIELETFKKLKSKYEKKYLLFKKFIDDGYKIKGGTLGRGELKYSRNILYGWFLEAIIKQILSVNTFVKDIDFFGTEEVFRDKIKKITKKYPEIEKEWSELEQEVNKLIKKKESK